MFNFEFSIRVLMGVLYLLFFQLHFTASIFRPPSLWVNMGIFYFFLILCNTCKHFFKVYNIANLSRIFKCRLCIVLCRKPKKSPVFSYKALGQLIICHFFLPFPATPVKTGGKIWIFVKTWLIVSGLNVGVPGLLLWQVKHDCDGDWK